MQVLRKILTNCSGATAIEYALIAAGVSLVILGSVYSVGGQVAAMLSAIADGLAGLLS